MVKKGNPRKSTGIGTLSEGSLHAELKKWVGQAGDLFEAQVGSYTVDVVRGDLLIEVQTGNFSAMKKKLPQLLKTYEVLLLHPIAKRKWIVREDESGEWISRRKSPKTSLALELFHELIRIPHLLNHPRLTIGAIMTHENEILRDDGQGSRRRKGWSRRDRELIEVVAEHYFDTAFDYLTLIPDSLVRPFSCKELAKAARIKLNLARCVTYTLRKAESLEVVGKRGNTRLYDFATED